MINFPEKGKSASKVQRVREIGQEVLVYLKAMLQYKEMCFSEQIAAFIYSIFEVFKVVHNRIWFYQAVKTEYIEGVTDFFFQ